MNLQPPTYFCSKNGQSWSGTLGLVEKGKEHQVSTSLCCLGEDAGEVLDTTQISANGRKKYQSIIEEFDKYFKVKKNVTLLFNQCSKLLGELADCFITEMYRLVENCEFRGMKEELTHDQPFEGFQDSTSSVHLQLELEPTLKKSQKLNNLLKFLSTTSYQVRKQFSGCSKTVSHSEKASSKGVPPTQYSNWGYTGVYEV